MVRYKCKYYFLSNQTIFTLDPSIAVSSNDL